MPTVNVMMFSGRSLDQKRRLVRGITDVVAEALGVSTESVTVRITETSRENTAYGGILSVDA